MLNTRIAHPKDAEKIVAIKKGIVMTNDVLLRLPEDKQETADEYRKKMQKKQDNGGLTLIIERKDEVIGFLSFSRSSYKRLHHTGSFGISVKPECSNLGAGTKLLSYLIKWAKEQEGLEKINLDVFSNNKPAIHLYQKLGFKEEGKQVNQIKLKDGSYADIIFMSLYL
ncbi:GNAT family N-acetyltransferase [Priestia megaterium]|jgi:RimJ/RimL family protein N-acetyltransferase|uniref:GNAT family N-acetyltransferase n=1 Tax=Priestia megaterium TaxID=1404 RepID=UPI002281C4A0|nr:GNAT family N-acetyltransferase [Priestia megaterium]MCY9017072.1 GNAT family N-acetyltransferase [Priestia megaterium]MCY9025802.1 GNAT family N-acetyltransferase [Priestia megaterium]